MVDCITGKKKVLMVFTSISAGISTVLLVLSIAGEHWLYTKELYKGALDDLYFLPENFTGPVYIATNFGLWRSCQQYIDKNDVIHKDNKCKIIPYKDAPEESKEEDTILSDIISFWLSIPWLGSCRKTAIFPLVSVLFEIVADILCLLGYCFGRRRHLVFLTGVLFVVSGMSLLVGSILFMGAVTGDANHQPAVAKDEIPIFRYWYGSSFFMMAASFCLDEMSGVLSVYLFIIRHKESVKKKHAKLRAFKSKADQIQNYFKRKSRHHTQSLSSNGDVLSRRSSYMPLNQEAPSYKDIERDTSHFTIMTTVESHQVNNHINQNQVKPTSIPPPPEIEITDNDSMMAERGVETGREMTMFDMPPPPGEFSTRGSDVREKAASGKRLSRCRTTEV